MSVALLLHEIWRADGDCTAITCCLAGPMGDQARSMLEPGAYLLQLFVADSQFEAGTVRNRILGFEPYRSEWEEIDRQPYPEDWAMIQNREPRTAATQIQMRPMTDDRQRVEQLTAALTKAATRDDTADAHRLLSVLISARGADALPLFHRATKRSKKCTFALASLLLERGDTGCAVSDAAIIAILADQKHIARDAVLGSMQASEQSRFAPQLREIAKLRTDAGWAYAVDALGKWGDQRSVDSLISQCAVVDTPFVLLAALVRLRPPEAAVVFEANLAHAEPRERAFALWGLAALGYQEAIGALIGLLDDPDLTTAASFTPGQSMRAAQALADVWGLEFDWGDQTEIEKIRQHCRSLYAPDDIKRMAASLATGQLTRMQPPRQGEP
jgi:hypothetical protein